MPKGKAKGKTIIYLCDACGAALERTRLAKKDLSLSDGASHKCGQQFTTVIETVKGVEKQKTRDTTIRVKGLCTAPATGSYHLFT